MRVGDKIYCKENLPNISGFDELIKGEKYIIIDTSPQPYIKIINEYGHYHWYGISLFYDLNEYRKLKLKKLLNEFKQHHI